MGSPDGYKELEVLKLVCCGHTNKMIAIELKIKVRTVESHRSSLYKKTGTLTVVQLALFAIRHGLV